MVGMESMKNGIGGDGTGDALSNIAGLGITLGAMGGVISMTKEAMSPIFDAASQIGKGIGSTMGAAPVVTAVTWDCACGTKNIQSKFCPECGAKKPEPKLAADTWDCPQCGNKGITGKFCGECGWKKPEAPATWDCPQCGNKGITGKFCGECGTKRIE